MARRKDHTREELTEIATHSARELVRAEGPSALTARKVAKEIGYTPGTLYNLFENIDDLAAAINRDTLRTFAEDISNNLKKSKSAKKQLQHLCETYLALQQTEPHLWKLLFDTHLSHESEAYSQAIHRVFDQVVATVRPLTSSTKAARQDAKIIWSTLHGICLLQQSGKLDITEIDTPETLIKRFLTRFL